MNGAPALIRFRSGAAGRRKPYLVGTRLLVRHLITAVKDHNGNIEDAASYLDVSPRLVRAAVSFYAEFASEIAADGAWAAQVEADEAARGERAQATLA